MRETPIFRNLQHVPRIWGITYVKLFGSLGIGLLLMTVSFAFANRGSALGKIAVIVLSVLATAGLYGISFWLDNRDPLGSNTTPFLSNEFNSQSISLQQLILLDHEVSGNEIQRPSRRHHQARAETR